MLGTRLIMNVYILRINTVQFVALSKLKKFRFRRGRQDEETDKKKE